MARDDYVGLHRVLLCWLPYEGMGALVDTGTLAAMGRTQIVPVVFHEPSYAEISRAWKAFMEEIARAEVLVEQGKRL